MHANRKTAREQHATLHESSVARRLIRLPVSGEDWTDEEKTHLARLTDETGLMLEAGRADEGDPWCIVYDGTVIVAHVARIGRSYVVHWPNWQQSEQTSSLRAAVDLVLTRG